VLLTHPVETDAGVQTADSEVLLGAGLGAQRGEARTLTLSLALAFLIAALPGLLERTGLATAQALTGAGGQVGLGRGGFGEELSNKTKPKRNTGRQLI